MYMPAGSTPHAQRESVESFMHTVSRVSRGCLGFDVSVLFDAASWAVSPWLVLLTVTCLISSAVVRPGDGWSWFCNVSFWGQGWYLLCGSEYEERRCQLHGFPSSLLSTLFRELGEETNQYSVSFVGLIVPIASNAKLQTKAMDHDRGLKANSVYG